MDKILRAWLIESKRLENGDSTKEEYDEWRYKYPELDTHQKWAKVPSQDLMDMIFNQDVKESDQEDKTDKHKKNKK